MQQFTKQLTEGPLTPLCLSHQTPLFKEEEKRVRKHSRGNTHLVFSTPPSKKNPLPTLQTRAPPPSVCGLRVAPMWMCSLLPLFARHNAASVPTLNPHSGRAVWSGPPAAIRQTAHYSSSNTSFWRMSPQLPRRVPAANTFAGLLHATRGWLDFDIFKLFAQEVVVIRSRKLIMN